MSDSNEEKTIGAVVGAARKGAGMSLRDLAAKLEVHFTYLADIEKNNRKPSEKVLRGLSEQTELDLNFDELMAKAGRLGSEAEQYLTEHPKFGSLVRRIVRENLDDAQLAAFSEEVLNLIRQIKKLP